MSSKVQISSAKIFPFSTLWTYACDTSCTPRRHLVYSRRLLCTDGLDAKLASLRHSLMSIQRLLSSPEADIMGCRSAILISIARRIVEASQLTYLSSRDAARIERLCRFTSLERGVVFDRLCHRAAVDPLLQALLLSSHESTSKRIHSPL